MIFHSKHRHSLSEGAINLTSLKEQMASQPAERILWQSVRDQDLPQFRGGSSPQNVSDELPALGKENNESPDLSTSLPLLAVPYLFFRPLRVNARPDRYQFLLYMCGLSIKSSVCTLTDRGGSRRVMRANGVSSHPCCLNLRKRNCKTMRASIKERRDTDEQWTHF